MDEGLVERLRVIAYSNGVSDLLLLLFLAFLFGLDFESELMLLWAVVGAANIGWLQFYLLPIVERV